MEELLNKLIEKGWKVYHRNYTKCVNVWRNCAYFMYTDEYGRPKSDIFFSLRELCAKESGLWQFVCENRMVKEDDGHIARIINLYKSDEVIVDGGWNYHYWLMICSILDETDLEQFLLDNIKVE